VTCHDDKFANGDGCLQAAEYHYYTASGVSTKPIELCAMHASRRRKLGGAIVWLDGSERQHTRRLVDLIATKPVLYAEVTGALRALDSIQLAKSEGRERDQADCDRLNALLGKLLDLKACT
jgi:hypothetical protein